MKGVYLKKYIKYLLIVILLILFGFYIHKVSSNDGFQNDYKVSFVTYANDTFKAAGQRIEKEAKGMGIFNGNIQVYSPDDLDEEFMHSVKDIIHRHRGGGYWLWKPYVVSRMLQKVNTDDYVVYADAGCKLQKENVHRLREYLDMISPSSGKSVLAMRFLGYAENIHTTKQIFDYFGVNENDDAYSSFQIVTGLHIYRKCDESVAMVNRWLEVATTRPDLFTDDYNQDTKIVNPKFIENRHDQSVYSMILKTQPYKNIAVVIDEEIEPNDVTGITNRESILPVVAKRLRT
jgi:hypothetical protein